MISTLLVLYSVRMPCLVNILLNLGISVYGTRPLRIMVILLWCVMGSDLVRNWVEVPWNQQNCVQAKRSASAAACKLLELKSQWYPFSTLWLAVSSGSSPAVGYMWCHEIYAVQLPTMSRGGLVPKSDLCSSQLWSRLVLWNDWITGDYSREWGWEGEKAKGCICVGQLMSVSLLFGCGECHRCHWLGSLCRNTHRGNCFMGDCDIQGQRELQCYPVSLPFPKLPWVSDSPSWSPVKEVPRVGSVGLWRTSSEAEASAFKGKCPAEWFPCYWGCAL